MDVQISTAGLTTEPGPQSTADFQNRTEAAWSAGEISVCKRLDQVSDIRVNVTCGLDRYVPPFLFVVGFISNCLVILVMRSKSFRKLSTSFYMVANASVDILSLLISLPIHWLFVNFPELFQPLQGHHWLCACLNFVGWGTSDLGVLFTVAMTTERALAIRLPLKAPRLCTRHRARWAVAGLTLLEVLMVGHLIFTSQSMVGGDTTSRLCDVRQDDPGYAWFHAYVWPWLHTAMLIACYLLAALGNVVIMKSLASSRKGVLLTSLSGWGESTSPAVSAILSSTLSSSNRSLASHSGTDQNNSLSSSISIDGMSAASAASLRDKLPARTTPGSNAASKSQRSQLHSSRNLQLSVMLVTDSLTLVLCTLPFSVVELLMTRYQVLPNQAGGKNLAFTTTFYMLYVNRCLNFFLYCLSGARFRSALVEIFHPSRENRQSGAISTVSRAPQRSAFPTTVRNVIVMGAFRKDAGVCRSVDGVHDRGKQSGDTFSRPDNQEDICRQAEPRASSSTIGRSTNWGQWEP
ncbi:hypothetical protein EGW08_001515 [Elysia chlorotica]|uniref:G-protein coupled receptors family 1 profile domain-containing protein n=1 Tax=Elysia chlorotica TaxID=188477 RepID=A0A3S1BWT4_ELYCH|nr:hypothetical protein EGW08_001515 [Elysia chlorotica]